MTFFHALMCVKADGGSPNVGARGSRRALDLGAAISPGWLLCTSARSREMKELWLCALACHALEMNGIRGKFTGKGVCTKHLKAFQAFFEVGTGRYWVKTCGLEMYFQLFLK